MRQQQQKIEAMPITPATVIECDLKLAFFDIDGTLLGKEHRATENVELAFRYLHDQGVTCSLASGRPAFAATQIAKQLGINGPSVFEAGAVILDSKSWTPESTKELPPELTQRLCDFLSSNNYYFELYTPKKYYTNNPEAEESRLHSDLLGFRPLKGELDAILSTDETAILKIMLVWNTPDTTSRTRQIEALKAEFPEIHVNETPNSKYPNLYFGALTSPEAKRDNAYHYVLRKLNLSSPNVLAVGDGLGDVPFIQLAGVGVAMGNSSLEVQRKANYVAPPVTEDGILSMVKALRLPEKPSFDEWKGTA